MSIENRLKSIEDETAIRALVARFADACVTADYKAFERLWSEHRRWTIHELYLLSSKGVDDIVEMMANLRTDRDFRNFWAGEMKHISTVPQNQRVTY
jgi:hypothetical protein